MVKTVNKHRAENCPTDKSGLGPDISGLDRIYPEKGGYMFGPLRNFLLNFDS
jgi:hypothetical protein